MKKTMLALVLLFTSACATHGPFVRNLVKGDGNSLEFQECYLYINGFWGNTETQACKDKKITFK